jgi:acyl carrier protein
MRAEQSSVQPKSLNLRYVIFGGEMLEMQCLKPWFDRHGDQTPQLINMYGITETTVHVTYRPLSQADLGAGSLIGAPIPDLQLYILDSEGRLAGRGESGELFVGGAGLARGYLNRPELNEKRFVADPFSQRPGARLYRTGDLARALPNGDVEYLGRIDHQVKIRGFRIELGEIEVALNRHVAISEAVVLVREDQPGDKYLAAYLVARAATKPAWNELRNFLKISLPEHMVPAAFVFLEKLPLNVNGKLDRDALLGLPVRDEPPLAPVGNASEFERNIYKLWAEALRGAPAGLDDNFFDLGGDSLLLVQIHARLQAMIGREFPLTDLFMHTTIRALAKHLGGGEPKTAKLNSFQERARRQQAAFGMSGSRLAHKPYHE